MNYQRQDSLDAQMRDVMKKAVEMGCYDAHDWLRRHYLRVELHAVAREAIAEARAFTTNERSQP